MNNEQNTQTTGEETQILPREDVGSVEADVLVDPTDLNNPAPANDAQAKAAEILAARKGKVASAQKAVKEPKAPKEPSEPKAPKAEGTIKTGYRFLRELDANDKLNNQQKIIIDEMLKLVDNNPESPTNGIVLREPLIEALKNSTMVTRQPYDRVFGFYLNSWKKDIEATEKKPAIPALLEVVKVQFKN